MPLSYPFGSEAVLNDQPTGQRPPGQPSCHPAAVQRHTPPTTVGKVLLALVMMLGLDLAPWTHAVQARVIYQYWRYEPTGRLWAVTLVGGVLRRACGPLDPREMSNTVLPFLPFDARDVRWLRDQSDKFVVEDLSAASIPPSDSAGCGMFATVTADVRAFSSPSA